MNYEFCRLECQSVSEHISWFFEGTIVRRHRSTIAFKDGHK